MSGDSSQGAKHVARKVSASYGELALVEMPAIDLLTSLGWRFKNLYAETFGALGSEGRESETQVVLTRRLRAALEALNPGLPADAYAQAVEQLTQNRSRQIAVNANREVYRLLKDSVNAECRTAHRQPACFGDPSRPATSGLKAGRRARPMARDPLPPSGGQPSADSHAA